MCCKHSNSGNELGRTSTVGWTFNMLTSRKVATRQLLPFYMDKCPAPAVGHSMPKCSFTQLLGSPTTRNLYMVQRRPPPPPPPVDGSWSPPPLWLWGCGGALLVSDAADFLWFLVPPPPLWMCGWVMVVVAVLEVCI